MINYNSPNTYSTSLQADTIDYLGEDSLNYFFGVYYKIDRSEIVKQSLNKLVITVARLNYPQASSANLVNSIKGNIYNRNNFLDESEEVRRTIAPDMVSENDDLTYDPNMLDILTKEKQIINKVNLQDRLILTKITVSDLIRFVPAEARVALSRSQVDAGTITSLRTKAKQLLPLNSQQISLIANPTSNLTPEQIQLLNLYLISDYSLAPSEIVKKENTISNKVIEDIKNFYLSSNVPSTSDPAYAVELMNQYRNNIRMRAYLPIKKELLDSVAENFVKITYELYRSEDNLPLATITQSQVALKNFSSISNLIKKEPTASSLNDARNRVIVSFFQNDRNANKISVSKKDISSSGECTEYKLIQDNFIQFQNSKNFFNTKDSFRSIYRFVSEYVKDGQQIKSTNFKDIVVAKNTDSFFDNSALIITDDASTSDRALIKLINPPLYATQYKIIKKQIVGKSIRHDTASEISSFKSVNDNSVYDSTVIDGESYEYTLFYKTNLGVTRRSKSYIHNYKNSIISSSGINTQITNYNIQKDESDQLIVNFNINTTINPGTNSDRLVQLLVNAGIKEEFLNDTTNINDTFKKLISHKVTRVNLATGERETFEVINAEDAFEDSPASRKVNSISTLKFGNPYRYEVRLSLIDINASLRDYVITETNALTTSQNNKIYYNPYKWKQPITKKTGMLLAQDSKNNFISPINVFDSFELGVSATKDINYTSVSNNIVSVQANRYQTKINYLSWELPLPLSFYDHFVIVKQVNRKKKILDAVHSSEYFDILSEDNDVGAVCYYITPIFSDFSVGQTKKSNVLIIQPSEYEFDK